MYFHFIVTAITKNTKHLHFEKRIYMHNHNNTHKLNISLLNLHIHTGIKRYGDRTFVTL